MLLRTLTDAEVIARYGDPSYYLNEDGTPSAAWPVAVLDTFWLPSPLPLSWDHSKVAHQVRCHKFVKDDLEAIFHELWMDKLVWNSINDYGGCYCWRPIRLQNKRLSRHSWGIAIDLDVCDNPQGGNSNMHPMVIAAFEARRWIWGGNFHSPKTDPMHFEVGHEI